MATRRAHGTGSVRELPNGKYLASVEAGWSQRGTRVRRTRTCRTRAEAQRAVRELLAQARSARAPQAGSRPTVRTWAAQWLAAQEERLRPATWRSYEGMTRRWIVPTMGHRRLDQLAPADRRAMTRAMHAEGLSANTVRRAEAVLGKMLKDAEVEGYTIPRAITLMPSAAGDVQVDRDAIPLVDALAILRTAATERDGSRWVAALLQGMRPGECLGLTWDRVDLDAGTLDVSWQLDALPYRIPRDRSSGHRIPAGYEHRQVYGALHLVRPKTARGRRIIPLVPWMREALAAWQEVCPPSEVGLVWPREDGRPRSDKADGQAWRDLCHRAGVSRILDDGSTRPYALYEARHTTATLLRQAGVDEETIQAIMGHATILSTRAYLHTDEARTRMALEAVAQRLELITPTD